MHFDFTISLGQMVTLGVVTLATFRLESLISRFGIEHEILIRDYCERKGIRLGDLPTRFRRGLFEKIFRNG